MRKLGMGWSACLLLASTIGFAQGLDRVCEVNLTHPKPGAAKDFEEARKKHNEFHRTEKDKNSIVVWQVVTGPHTGSYVTTVCDLTWKQLDGHEDFDKRDGEDINRTLSPTIAQNTAGYYVLRPELSLAPNPQGPPPRMISVVHYYVKPSGITQFTDAIKRINEAIVKSKYPVKPSRWFSLANGGEGPHYVLVGERQSWADMQGPEQQMADMLKQVYGNDDKSLQNLRDAVDHVVSEMNEYRADLSYLLSK